MSFDIEEVGYFALGKPEKVENTSEQPFPGKMIIVKPAEARRLASKYGIHAIEVTRLTQIKNLDVINGTDELTKKYHQVTRQVATLKLLKDDKLCTYWDNRKIFMREFFFLTLPERKAKKVLTNYKEGDEKKVDDLFKGLIKNKNV